MNKEELKNIPGLEAEDSVTIWKMNYGFRSDLQGEISEMNVQQIGNKTEGKANMDITKYKILNLVYGIFESKILNIKPPIDLGMGLNQQEKEERIRAIRMLNGEAGTFLFKKIGELNKEPEDELKKKLNSSLTEKE